MGVLHFMYNSCNEFWELESKILSGFEVKFVLMVKKSGSISNNIGMDILFSNRELHLKYLKFLFFSIGSMNLFLMAVPCSYYIWH